MNLYLNQNFKSDSCDFYILGFLPCFILDCKIFSKYLNLNIAVCFQLCKTILWLSYETLSEWSPKKIRSKLQHTEHICPAVCEKVPTGCCGNLSFSRHELFPMESVEHELWWCSIISVEGNFSLNSLIRILCCINKSIMLNQLDMLC